MSSIINNDIRSYFQVNDLTVINTYPKRLPDLSKYIFNKNSLDAQKVEKKLEKIIQSNDYIDLNQIADSKFKRKVYI